MDDEGTRLSSTKIWAQGDGIVYSLLGDARRRTALRTGGVSSDINAGDEYGQAVAHCIPISHQPKRERRKRVGVPGGSSGRRAGGGEIDRRHLADSTARRKHVLDEPGTSFPE